MRPRPVKFAVFLCFLTTSHLFAANRYWVHQTFYENFFSTPAEIADWQLIEDDGTGGFASSGSGTAILTMDDAAGSFANRLFNINGLAPRLMPFDGTNGRVELLVKSITGGNQRIFLQAQEFDGSGTYLGQVDIVPAQSATGFFPSNLVRSPSIPLRSNCGSLLGERIFPGSRALPNSPTSAIVIPPTIGTIPQTGQTLRAAPVVRPCPALRITLFLTVLEITMAVAAWM